MSDKPSSEYRPWSMTFQVCGDPRCPGCCEPLASIVITFREGWAWCPVCHQAQLYAEVHTRFVLASDVMHRASVLSHGLRFYVPVLVDGKYKNIVDMYEYLLNNPELPLRPSRDWPGFDLVQLPQVIRDRDRRADPPWVLEVLVPAGFEIAGITRDHRTVLVESDLTRSRKPSDPAGKPMCRSDTLS